MVEQNQAFIPVTLSPIETFWWLEHMLQGKPKKPHRSHHPVSVLAWSNFNWNRSRPSLPIRDKSPSARNVLRTYGMIFDQKDMLKSKR